MLWGDSQTFQPYCQPTPTLEPKGPSKAKQPSMSQEPPTPEAQVHEAAHPSITAHITERGVIVNGRRLAVAMSNAPRALVARVPLIVLPEVGSVWEDYRSLLEHFALERRVFALDWPGFGGSAKPHPGEYSYRAGGYVDVLAGWLDTLGIARAVLIGNGIGGAVALRYTAAYPQRVLGLALLAPVGFVEQTRASRLVSRLLGAPALLRRLEPLVTSLALGPTTSDTIRAVAERHRTLRTAADHMTTLAALSALWRDARRPDTDLPAVAKGVRTAAVVIRGALDPLVTAAEAQRAAEGIGERGALAVTLPEAGHLPFLQQPERCFQALAGLLGAAELAAAELS